MKYSIGQVSKIVKLRQSVLRFWESEFKQLSPEKTSGGTRKYSDHDIDLILRIKDLLYNQKFTIEGAKAKLEHIDNVSDKKQFDIRALKEIVNELESILEELKK